jgi:3-hydroxymyristoyl/3-hydroxydecanoyl-(acyl carrier protein) dehydratase
MDGHFRAFSFVDRVLDVEPGVRAQGRYAVPAALACFPTALVAESVGQLAAWLGMAATEFQRRPVAGLAGRIEILSDVQPGQLLDLEVELQQVDAEAIAYRGLAKSNGKVLLRLDDCVGPMLAADDFDDPLRLRDRFAVLCGPGVPPGAFPGVEGLALEEATMEPGRCQATLPVPEAAPFFADHFPRRPVLPGTLLLDAMFRLAAVTPALSGGSSRGAAAWRPCKASDVKLRAFIAPGERLDLEANVTANDADQPSLELKARAGRRSVASARVELTQRSTG